MAKKFRWIPATTESDPDHHLAAAAVQVSKGTEPASCSLCGQSALRYYQHTWCRSSAAPKPRATVWIWCHACSHWTHTSGLEPCAHLRQQDPFDDEKVASMESLWFVDKLNRHWESGLLPQLKHPEGRARP